MIFKIALCQMNVEDNKKNNMKKAEKLVKSASENGAQIIILPEMWNCPYSNEYFTKYAEPQDGDSFKFLSRIAMENNVYLIGGSVPESDSGKTYNTSYSFDRKGKLIGKYRKIHLFDIDIKGGIRFMESETLSPGNESLVIETEFGKIGIGICFDVRFPELFRKMVLEGARLIALPGAFNMTTGPAHWELTLKARALDNQVYFAACSPARGRGEVYTAYGNSCVVNPWGSICGKTDERESIVYANIDYDYLEDIRDQLPLLKARKPGLY